CFFFQAEDGIRDYKVTGVQTCALPIFVYLPSGYSASSNRYPVVYFLHGLPATSTSYLQLDWVAHALEQSGREAILVVPQGTRVEIGRASCRERVESAWRARA